MSKLGKSPRNLQCWEGLKLSWVSLKTSWEGLRASWEGLRASWEGPKASWEALRASWEAPGGDGRTDGRTNERTEFLPILQDFVPYRGRCPKSRNRVSVALGLGPMGLRADGVSGRWG